MSNICQDLKRAENKQQASVRMGDVNFRERIDNNRGVVMGHVYNVATDGIRITGSSTVRIESPVRQRGFN